MPPSAVVPPLGQSHYFAPKIIRVVQSSDEVVRLRNCATRTITLAVRADGDLSYGERLQPFDIVCVMPERTPMTRTIIERLPKLRMIASTATRNASIS